MESVFSMAAITFWALCAAGIAWYASEVAKDVTYVTLADGRRQERSIPMVFKMLLPFVGNLDRSSLARCSQSRSRRLTGCL